MFLAGPTLYNGAPIIVNQTLHTTNTSILFSIVFYPKASYPGSIFCAALRNTPTITSIAGITDITNVISETYLVGDHGVSLLVNNLKASTYYDTYCFVQTINGVTSSLVEIQNTHNNVKTLCCNTLSFTNTPIYIYSDLDKYINQNSNLYLYKFTLSNLPSSYLAVNPKIYDMQGVLISTNNITTIPSVIEFTTNSTTLSGSFVVDANNNIDQQSVVLSLVLSGASAVEYVVPEGFKLSILSSNSIPPAPNLLKATFTDSAANVLITFDSATNLGGVSTSSWSCTLVFEFIGDTNAYCSWISNTVVQISFGKYSSSTPILNPNDQITLLSNVIKSACSNNCNVYPFQTEQSVSVGISDNVLIPTVVISVARTISSCDDVFISTTLSYGHGSRDWISVKWVVTAQNNANTSQITNYLESFGVSITKQIQISNFFFDSTTYFISLTLTNFLGQSSRANTLFTIDAIRNLPILNILQSNEISVNVSSSLTVRTSVQRSSCAENYAVSYQWFIYDINNKAIDFKQLSNDPAILLLSPYALVGGQIYTVFVYATASATQNYGEVTTSALSTINVRNSNLKANINGGYQRIVVPQSELQLDATSSIDMNIQNQKSSVLLYSWSCSVASISNYGENCNYLYQVSNVGILVYNGLDLIYGTIYQFTVYVSTLDGRSDSTSVLITRSEPGSDTTAVIPTTSILLVSKVNANERISLDGHISASYGLSSNWSARIDGSIILFPSLSPQVANFTESVVGGKSFVSFSLTVESNTFSPGNVITFRLSANRLGYTSSKYFAYSDVVITLNSPPVGGWLDSDPVNGQSLSTVYQIVAVSWSDDVDDYPLAYSFSYQVSQFINSALTIQTKKGINTVSTQLPSGIESEGFQIQLIMLVYDNLGASNSANTFVSVVENENVNYLSYLSSNLLNLDGIGSPSALVQTINLVASAMGRTNCSLASPEYCASLNRDVCSSKPNTCSNCLSGFTGVFGNSNMNCVSKTGLVGNSGDKCITNNDCLYNLCTNSTCSVPSKRCPSDCSGHGQCIYSTSSGTSVSKCSVDNVQCSAMCACTDGYGGTDCSLDEVGLFEADQTIFFMCKTFVSAQNSSNLTPDLVDSYVSTMEAIYSPDKVISDNTTNICSKAMKYLTTEINSGGLQGTNSATTSNIVESASKFIKFPSNGSQDTSNEAFQYISQISSGVLQNMVNGQASTDVVSGNIRLRVIKSDLSSISSLSPPQSDEESFYGSPVSSSVVFSSESTSILDSGDGYLHMSLSQWDKNPFPAGMNLLTHQFQIQTSTTLTSSVTNRRSLSASGSYFLSYQFNTKLNESDSYAAFPSCMKYNPSLKLYEPCVNCETYLVTDYNVTYECFDFNEIVINYNTSTNSTTTISSTGAFLSTPPTLLPTIKPSFSPTYDDYNSNLIPSMMPSFIPSCESTYIPSLKPSDQTFNLTSMFVYIFYF